ncbi:MAG: hypothetical protein ABEJ65_12460 [bacterium]
MFGALIKQATDQLIDSIDQVLDREESSLDQLRGIFWAHFELFEDSRLLVEILVNEGLDQLGERREVVVQRWEQYNDRVAQAFSQGIEQGIFRDEPPLKLARLYLGWIWGMLRSVVIFDENDPREQYGQPMLDMFLKGLKRD